MDQQFQTYEKFLKRKWDQFYALIIPVDDKLTRKRLMILSLFLTITAIIPLIPIVGGLTYFIANDIETFWALLYLDLGLFVLLTGTFTLTFGKKIGWILINITLLKRSLSAFFQVIFFKLFMDEFYVSPSPLDSIYRFDFKGIIVSVFIFCGILWYLNSSRVRTALKVSNYLRLAALLIGLIWFITNEFLIVF